MLTIIFILAVFWGVRHYSCLSTLALVLALIAGAIAALIFCPVAGIILAIAWALLASNKTPNK
ncbi:MAG: hypothetical protein HGA96_00240 [Desulfobulbaceae bacterium]|nr:hypothetical protein [Desulfobulbaceae bacterium]